MASPKREPPGGAAFLLALTNGEIYGYILRPSRATQIAERQVRSVCNVPSAVRLLQLGFGRGDPTRTRAYLCFWTLSNPFSNWVTSGVSPDARPSRPMTRQR